jgi:uncharacterized alpha-E superfamily protein
MYQSPSPLLLSRVADSAYWAGRYLERAEGTARLVKSHADLVMDLPRAAGVGWEPLLAVLGVADDAVPPSRRTCEEDVIGYLTGDLTNASSVRSAIAAVHRNLRVTRAVMPIEAVEVLTELHHHVEDTSDHAVDRRTRNAWLTSVIRSSQSLSAILAETMTHDDAFCFFTVGRQLERADLTTRVLDVQQGVLTRSHRGPLEPYLDICWFAVLRSVSALQAFRRTGTQGSAEATIAFLLHDTKCPRTVESCLIEAARWLLEIPGHGDAMAACARAQDTLADVDVAALVDGGLTDFVDVLQKRIADVHAGIEASWFAPASAQLV